MRSRFGRRTLLLFVACALAPVTLLAGWAYWEIRLSLIERAQVRVDVAAKEAAIGFVDRATTTRDLFQLLVDRGVRSGGTRISRIWQDEALPGPADSVARVALALGGTPDAPAIELSERRGGVVVHGEVPIDKVIGFAADEMLDPAVCLLVPQSRRLVGCSAGVSATEAAAVARLGTGEARADELIWASRPVFLGYEFASPDWRVVAFRRRADVLASVNGVGRTFLEVAVLSLLVVFFVSHVQIRRITRPLEQLTRATRGVQAGDFAARVEVATADEFGTLAEGFNAMSAEIGRHVGTLEALTAVDRTALEGHGVDVAVEVGMQSVVGVTGAERVVVILPRGRDPGHWRVHEFGRGPHDGFLPAELCLLRSERVVEASECSERLARLGVAEATAWEWSILPLRHAGTVEGALAIGARTGGAAPSVDLARRVADRLAAALANLRLVRELDEFTVGSLTAFARVVDANSSWTAGHSERVTATSVALARRLGMSPADVETIRRGGLLHDIGKIGVPSAILDKPGVLTADERRVIESHTVIGYDILAPMAALRDVLPLVRSHHERLDGSGYPDGLAAAEISPAVRILAVADVYDALTSDRPYRPGMPLPEVLSMMTVRAPARFDRDVLHALVGWVTEQGFAHTTPGGLVVPAPVEVSA